MYIYIYISQTALLAAFSSFLLRPPFSTLFLPFRFIRFFLACVSISYASRRYTFSQVDVSLKFPTLPLFFFFFSHPFFAILLPFLVSSSLSLSSFIIYREIKEKKYIYSYTSKEEVTSGLSSDRNEIFLGEDTCVHTHIHIYRIHFDPFLPTLASIFFLRRCSHETLVPKASKCE